MTLKTSVLMVGLSWVVPMVCASAGCGSGSSGPVAADAGSADDSAGEAGDGGGGSGRGDGGDGGGRGDSSGGGDEGGAAESGSPSPYDTACTSPSVGCPAPLYCQAFAIGGTADTGYACTQSCNTTSDCGALGNSAVQCLIYGVQSYCLITCSVSGANSCPGSLQCKPTEGGQDICVNL
jgi:hypothetical protein